MWSGAAVHPCCCSSSPSQQGGIAMHKEIFSFLGRMPIALAQSILEERAVCPQNCWCPQDSNVCPDVCPLLVISFLRYEDLAILWFEVFLEGTSGDIPWIDGVLFFPKQLLSSGPRRRGLCEALTSHCTPPAILCFHFPSCVFPHYPSPLSNPRRSRNQVQR